MLYIIWVYTNKNYCLTLFKLHTGTITPVPEYIHVLLILMVWDILLSISYIYHLQL